MTRESTSAYCTNAKWLGREHCAKCHIRQLMLFSELPETAFEKLLQPIDHFLYPPNALLYKTGSDKKFIYSIRRGMVKLTHNAQDGTNRILRLLGPGSAIGLELLDGADSYHHTATAINEVDLCKIPVSTIKQLETDYPMLCTQVRSLLQGQLNIADQWIVDLSTGTARQRVTRLLLILNELSADKDGHFLLLGREDMAAITGVTAETVSRVIAEFKRKNALRKQSGGLYQCDVDQLRSAIKDS